MTWEDGIIYEGEWNFGFAEGKGKLTTNEFVYKGYFKNNEMNGEGKIYIFHCHLLFFRLQNFLHK